MDILLTGSDDQIFGRITRSKNATARSLASGSSGGGSLHALPLGVCCTILGTLIVAPVPASQGAYGGE